MTKQTVWLLSFLAFTHSGNLLAQFSIPRDFSKPTSSVGVPVMGGTYRVPKTKAERKSKTHSFLVLFKDSTTLTLDGKIDSYNNKYFLSIENDTTSRSIPSRETISITRIDRQDRVGIATDSCWLFKSSGIINSYSVLSEDNVAFTIAIQEGDGPVLPFTKQNFIGMMREDSPYTRQLLREGQLHQALLRYNYEMGKRKR